MIVHKQLWSLLLSQKEIASPSNCLGWSFDGRSFSAISKISEVQSTNTLALLLKNKGLDNFREV
jgi:hypothetical protein